jgi:MFS transporter, OPA family, solute carrier family 37 (glycerol-3-phosphate transporter), member 3
MYNLPSFLSSQYGFSSSQQADISTLNDLGAILGSLLLGKISDLTYGKRSPVAMISILTTCVIFYSLTIGNESQTYTSLLVYLFLFGFFLQSANNTICAVCSADIGSKQPGLKVTSTVTGIIDGSGSLGAAIAHFTIGLGRDHFGWQLGYLLPISMACTASIIPIAVVLKTEIQEIRKIKNEKR